MTFTYSFEAIGSQLFSFRVRQHIHILGRQLKASQSLSVQKQLKKMTHPQNAKENCHCFPSRRVCACIIPASRAGWSQWLQGSKAGKTPTWGNSRQGPACLTCACSCFPLLRLPLTCSPALLAKKLPAAGETGSDLSCLVKNTSVSLTLEVVVNKPICENVSTVDGPFPSKTY